MLSVVIKLLSKILSFLPSDPIAAALSDSFDAILKYLGYINYFVPFYIFVPIYAAWGVAMGAMYLYLNAKEIMKLFISVSRAFK